MEAAWEDLPQELADSIPSVDVGVGTTGGLSVTIDVPDAPDGGLASVTTIGGLDVSFYVPVGASIIRKY